MRNYQHENEVLAKDNAALRAENKALQAINDMNVKAFPLLQAENETLKKDAERYRWLRRDDLEYEQGAALFDTYNMKCLDKAIDTAIDAERKEGA